MQTIDNLLTDWRKTKTTEKTTNLTIHRLLYFAFGLYYKDYKEKLFDNPKFESWMYGPVEIDYWYKRNQDKFILTEDKIKKLKKLLEKYDNLFSLSAAEIIAYSHLSDPWINNGSGELVSKEIPETEIIDYFDKEFEKEYNNLLKKIIKNQYYEIVGIHLWDTYQDEWSLCFFKIYFKNELKSFIDSYEITDDNAIIYTNLNNEKIKIKNNDISKKDKKFLKDITLHYKKNQRFHENANKRSENIYEILIEIMVILQKIINII